MQSGGVRQHGRQGRRLHHAWTKRCSQEGCANGAVRGGVCATHGATKKRWSNEGCVNGAIKGGVCVMHGAKKKRCSHDGCTNGVVAGGVWVTHSAITIRCKSEGCAKQAQKGGLCRRYDLYSIAATAAQNGAARPSHPAGGYDARSIVASDIAGGGGGGIEIDRRHLQTDVSSAAAPILPSLRPSDIIGAWIWRSSRTARLGGVNNSDGAL